MLQSVLSWKFYWIYRPIYPKWFSRLHFMVNHVAVTPKYKAILTKFHFTRSTNTTGDFHVSEIQTSSTHTRGLTLSSMLKAVSSRASFVSTHTHACMHARTHTHTCYKHGEMVACFCLFYFLRRVLKTWIWSDPPASAFRVLGMPVCSTLPTFCCLNSFQDVFICLFISWPSVCWENVDRHEVCSVLHVCLVP